MPGTIVPPVAAGTAVATFVIVKARVREANEVLNARTTNWCLIPCPTPEWGRLVHPDLEPADAHERLWEQPWPVADEAQLVRDTFELVVQVNGRVRDRFEVEASG